MSPRMRCDAMTMGEAGRRDLVSVIDRKGRGGGVMEGGGGGIVDGGGGSPPVDVAGSSWLGTSQGCFDF